MKNCPKCKSEKLVKNGFQGGKQRFKCKECGFNSTVEHVGYPDEFKAKVIRAYLDGIGVRALSRLFEIGVATVIGWVKQSASRLPEPEKPEKVHIMEIDEMHHWICEKKTLFGSGLRFAASLIESSTLRWAVVEYKQASSSGRK